MPVLGSALIGLKPFGRVDCWSLFYRNSYLLTPTSPSQEHLRSHRADVAALHREDTVNSAK